MVFRKYSIPSKGGTVNLKVGGGVYALKGGGVKQLTVKTSKLKKSGVCMTIPPLRFYAGAAPDSIVW